MALQSRVGGIDLQLKGGELGGLVQFVFEFVETRLVGVGKQKSH